MAKEGSREQQLRELREQQFAAAKQSRPRPPEAKPAPPSPKAPQPIDGHNGHTHPKAKRGRPRIEDRDKTLAATKPWLAAGMSRQTWYRRQAEKRNGEET